MRRISPSVVEIELLRVGSREPCAELQIAALDGEANTANILSAPEARARGEARCQLNEGRVYEYRLISAPPGAWIMADEIVRPNPAFPGSGRIDALNAVGVATVRLFSGDQEVANVDVEIVSTKIDYRREYREMVESIAEHAASLVLDQGTAQKLRFRGTTTPGSSPPQIRRELLLSMLDSQRFRAAVERILAGAETSLVDEERIRPIERLGRVNRSTLRQLTKPGGQRSVPPGSALKTRGINTVPSRLDVRARRDTADIDENRFVRHVLQQFLAYLEQSALEGHASMGEDLRVRAASRRAVSQLQQWLNHSVMRELGPLQRLPWGSPVLQRKDGYRELLAAWVMFNSISELHWGAGDEIFSSGRRRIATLYEYWVFFELFDVFRSLTAIEPKALQSLLSASSSSVELCLQRGAAQTFTGDFNEGRPLKVRFAYNSTFGRTTNWEQRGSWTRSMRPDFTFSIWPAELSLDDAERLELSVHVHFDAKYRLLKSEDIFGTTDDDQPIESTTYKRQDLLKMHAYRDAIRRSYGAYVIYPGQGGATNFTGYEELLPGLGAFPLRPGHHRGAGRALLRQFLRDVLRHTSDRASARERITYAVHQTYVDRRPHVRAPLPELVDQAETLTRAQPPTSQGVLIGWYQSQEHLDWIQRTGQYNIRTGSSRRGAIQPTPELLSASFLLLHHRGSCLPGLLRIERGFEVLRRGELEGRGYPQRRDGDPSDLFIVFRIAADERLAGWIWNSEKLALDQSGAPELRTLDLLLARMAETG